MMVIGTCPAPAPWPQQTWPTALGPTGPWRWVDACRQSSQLSSLPVSAHTWDGSSLIGPATVTYWGKGPGTGEKLAGGYVDPEAQCLKHPGQAASCLDLA